MAPELLPPGHGLVAWRRSFLAGSVLAGAACGIGCGLLGSPITLLAPVLGLFCGAFGAGALALGVLVGAIRQVNAWTRDRLDEAFEPLGAPGEPFLNGRQYHGTFEGRRYDLYVATGGGRRKVHSLELQVRSPIVGGHVLFRAKGPEGDVSRGAELLAVPDIAEVVAAIFTTLPDGSTHVRSTAEGWVWSYSSSAWSGVRLQDVTAAEIGGCIGRLGRLADHARER